MQIIGGIRGAIDIWEIAVIPALLNNCESWTDMSDDDMVVLENLQNLFLRMMLQIPESCPKPAILWETGTTLIYYRIMETKLKFCKYIQQQDDSILSKIFIQNKKD